MPMNDDNQTADLARALRALKDDATEPSLGTLVERTLTDAAFVAARRDAPVPSDLLMARTLRDARTMARSRRRREFVAWGSLAAACVMGVAVGLGDPGGYVATALGAGVVTDLSPDLSADLAGGYGFQYAELLP